MRFPAVLLTLTLFLWSCGGQNEDTDDAAGPTRPDPARAAELRQDYERFLSALTDTFPRQQIVEPGKLYPVDEALTDTAFFVFRESLRAAVRERDILKLMPHIAEEVEGPEGDRGLEAFTSRWNLETESQIQNSDLWPVLERVLSEGGAFSGDGRFRAPYAFATFPENTFSRDTFGAVTGDGVRMRESPSLNSAILALVSNDIVPILEVTTAKETIGGETHPWVKLRSTDGKEGFLWGKYVWYPDKYHAIFTLRDGQWMLTRLATGA